MKLLIYSLVYLGSALMAFNVFLYLRFARDVRKRGILDLELKVLNLPIFLLVLFLAGYLAVGIFGKPDLIIAWILFGGSIFVLVMLWLIRNTVDRIQESEHLKARLSVAEEASKAKTFFLANMSHDLRTPLNVIIGFTALACSEGVTPEQQREYFEKIGTAGQQLLGIVNNVLEMSRIESGKFDVTPARMNIRECIEETADMIRGNLTEKKIEFVSSCSVKNEWVTGDKILLNRVFLNLLSNAGKFTEAGGKITFTLSELSEDDGIAHYEVRVKDTGIGMKADFVEKLFQPFERERTSTVSKTEGTGIGLAITKNIVELMHGTIGVETEEGMGTEFIVSLPLPIEPDEAATPEPEAEAVRFDGRRVLLVEDNEINMEIAEMLLTQHGFAVERAENGKIAVDMVAASSAGYYDLVITDVQMPEMDGYEEARAIRALPDPALAGIPIVAMTANAFQEDVNASRDAGMNAHIAKPIDVSSMTKTIKEILENK